MGYSAPQMLAMPDSRPALLAVALLLSMQGLTPGCQPEPAAGASGSSPTPTAAPGKAGKPGGGGKPAIVEVAQAQPGEGTRSFRFLGQARAALDADLAPAVEGHVLSVKVREGDRVAQGALLLSLDGRKAHASLSAARATVAGTEAELAQAERQLARVKDVTGPALSEPEREAFALSVARLSARLQAERAEVERLEVESSQYSLRAPFAGVVARRLVDPGDWVKVGTPALSLVSLQDLEVLVDVPAEVGARLSVGDTATLHGSGEAAAEVVGVVPALDATTRTMRVRLSPAERPPWLLSGLALDVEFSVQLQGDGVLVPRDALLRGAVDTRVMRVVDGRAEPSTVEVIAGAGSQVLVHGGGLRAGQTVVVRGNERLQPGQPVQVRAGARD